MSSEREFMLDCLARWLIYNPDMGLRVWRNWSDKSHPSRKDEEFLDDMAFRVRREREKRGSL